MEESQKKWLWIMIALVAFMLLVFTLTKPNQELTSIDSGQIESLQTETEQLAAEQNSEQAIPVIGNTVEVLEAEAKEATNNYSDDESNINNSAIENTQ